MNDIKIKLDGQSYDGDEITIDENTNYINLFKELHNLEVISTYDLKINKDLFNKTKIEIEYVVGKEEIVFIVETNFLSKFLEFDFKNKYLSEIFIFKENFNKEKEIVYFTNKPKRRFSLTSLANGMLQFTIFKSKIKGIDKEQKEKYGLFYIPKFDGNNEPELKTLEEIDGNFNKDKKIAVIVHGLGSKIGKGYSGLFNYLKDDFNIFGFNYPSVTKSITDNSKDFTRYILSLKGIINEDMDIHVFAHSMGGLVSRSSLINDKAPITNIVMAGTPNGGVWYTEAHRARLLLSFFKNRLSFIPAEILETKYKDAKGIKDLNQNSPFLTDLNKKDNVSNCYDKYFALAGDFLFGLSDIIVPVNRVYSIEVGTNKLNIQSTVSNWHHFNYYSELDSSLKDGLDTARYCLKF